MLYDSPYLHKEEKVASTKSKEMTERNIQILLIAGVAYLVKKHIELVLHFCQSCQTLDPSSLALLTKEIVCRSFNRRRKRANTNHKVTFALLASSDPLTEDFVHMKDHHITRFSWSSNIHTWPIEWKQPPKFLCLRLIFWNCLCLRELLSFFFFVLCENIA